MRFNGISEVDGYPEWANRFDDDLFGFELHHIRLTGENASSLERESAES
jgi:hypothetical protein